MDKTTTDIVEYARAYWNSTPTDASREAALRHLVDSVACAIAGHATASAQIAKAVAQTMSSDYPTTVFGSPWKSAAQYASFANTVMIRSLDWNDGMLAPGGGHPSDMVPAVLAAGEVTNANGSDVIKAMILAYEVLGSLGTHVDRVDLQLDQGLFMGAATAVGVGMLYGLTDEQLANAISMSVVSAVPIQATRRGPLSMWKGAATAAAIMNATNAVAYAAAGMTAPAAPFEGEHGLMAAITGTFQLQIPAYPEGKMVVEISHQKMFPAESHSQAILGLAPRILEVASINEIEAIEVEAYLTLVVAIGKHPSVWDPKTRETADHSLPYLLAVALTDGGVTPASFTDERIADPDLRPLMAKISIEENLEYSAQYRPPGMELAGSPKLKITVTTGDGIVFDEVVTYARGHSLNPMTRADIDNKLDTVCVGVIGDHERDRIRDAWWNISDAPNIHAALETLTHFGGT
jgi:2-methylcitrate dehydratase